MENVYFMMNEGHHFSCHVYLIVSSGYDYVEACLCDKHPVKSLYIFVLYSIYIYKFGMLTIT